MKQLVERASSALADVDTAGWTLRFDLLSDPNRLEILLCLHRAPGICVGDLGRGARTVRKCGLASTSGASAAGLGEFHPVGREVSYRLEDEIVHELLHRIGARHQNTSHD